MALANALSSSVSGLDTTSTAISVIGDNIANVNTTGFKARRAEFADVLGQSITGAGGFSQIGAGAKLSRVSTGYTQGTFDSTGNSFDLAIEGNGFFILDGQQGTVYSRAGIFSRDNQNFLVNPEGLRVQGFGIDPVSQLSNGQLGDIQISTALSPPQPSGLMNLALNLDSGSTPTGPFDPLNPTTTSNFNTGITLNDSLGNEHFASIYFTKEATPGDWSWTATLPPADTTLPPIPNASHVIQGSGTLNFDTNGVMTTATGTALTFEFSGGGAPGQAVTLDFGPIGPSAGGSSQATTSFAGASSVGRFDQDGFGAGTLQSVNVDKQGYVTGQFSNGESIALAQVALATFPSVGGLTSAGSNNLISSRASGQPLIGEPGSGTFGGVRAGNLEMSTVDLADQFVKLIVNQRAFQANTRTVSVTNELMANLVSLGQ